MIYLDYASTSRPSEEVVQVFDRISLDCFGNPHSVHAVGYAAKKELEKARSAILDAFGVTLTHQVIFTSGATEGLDLALIGYALKNKSRGRKIISTPMEHPAVLESLAYLQREHGFKIFWLKVSEEGAIDLQELEDALDNETILVAIMALNNEIGTVAPVEKIASLVHHWPKCVFLSDVTQAVGRLPLAYEDIDLFAVSGHKIGGLKGAGCLIKRKSIALTPLLFGGGQEEGLRSGTVSVPLAASLAKAVTLTMKEEAGALSRVSLLNKALRDALLKRDDVIINSPLLASPYIFNFSLLQKKASVVVEALSNAGICVSSTSACQARLSSVSHVLKAIGRNDYLAGNAIRVSFSFSSSMDDVKAFLKTFSMIMETIR